MKNKNKSFLITIIFCLIVILILLVVTACSFFKNKENLPAQTTSIDNNQLDIKQPDLKSKNDESYFELQGFGQLTIDINNPYVNLINPEGNDVYLTFDVLYGDNVLFQTELIEPGKMIQFDVYRSLDAGEHTLTYSIDVYDKTTNNVLWSGIKQEQDILIKN